jgi:DNA-binding NtrC family response regulator
MAILNSTAPIDVLITDVGLPGLNGRQLADYARERRPDLRVLFMTGYAEGAAVRSEFLDPGMALIAKPFSIDAFAATICEMIQGRRETEG